MQSIDDHEGSDRTLAWVGAGRMGVAMASLLLRAGRDLTVFNRTLHKTEPLAAMGAKVVESMRELGSADIVFVTVGTSDDLLAVMGGEDGLLGGARLPQIVVDCSTVSADASAEARAMAAAKGVELLAAPVSGNPKVVQAGRMTMVVSGPRAAFEEAEPYLRLMAQDVTYVGEGEVSRLVKICHNLFLGVVMEVLAEVTLLAERGGVRRSDFLTFVNDSVVGSAFSRYKTPNLVNLDFEPSFTTRLLRKDFDLGLGVARTLEVPVPVVALVHQRLGETIGHGLGNADFSALVELAAKDAGIELVPEEVDVTDGLEPVG